MLPVSCATNSWYRLICASLKRAAWYENWLDHEAKSRDWQKRQTARSQGDLFQWADAQSEVSSRKQQPSAPAREPTRRRPQPKP